MRDPDKTVAAPGASGGAVGAIVGGFAYVVPGDRVKASLGLGIGVRLKPSGVTPGETLTVKIVYPDDYVSQWQADVGMDGQFEVGTAPKDGQLVMRGTYLFMAERDGASLFTFRIRVDGVETPGPCVAFTS